MNLLKHNITQKVYNNKKINDIIFNQNKRIVSIFKDNVICFIVNSILYII